VWIEEVKEFSPQDITEWALNNDPEIPRSEPRVIGTTSDNPDRPRYFWDQILFVRDDLAYRMFGLDKRDVLVVGTHMSKSVVLPVMYFSWGQIQFMMRHNYSNWCVSIRSPKLMDGIDFLDLFSREEVRGFFEGFPDEWKFDCLTANDYPLTSQFSFSVSDSYCLWTVCHLIKKWWEKRWEKKYGPTPMVIHDQ
jgi:hypothetical protein